MNIEHQKKLTPHVSSTTTEQSKKERAAARRRKKALEGIFFRQARAEMRMRNLLRRYKDAFKKAEDKVKKEKIAAEQNEVKRRLSKIAEEQNPTADWVNLDNAAMIFPSTDSPDINGMFRLSAILKDEVEPEVLQRALNSTVKRFPTISGSVKRGFFWYYNEPCIYPVVVEKESLFPCTRIPMDSRHSGIRVTYFKYRVSVDFFHAVTDGNGGLVFLNTLLGAYLRLKGAQITPNDNYIDDRDKPNKEEAVDSFFQMADLKTPKMQKDVVSYQIRGERLNNFSLVVVNGSVDSDKLNAVAKSYGATVGQYLTAAIAWAVEEDRRFYGYDKKRPVVVSVPANLRKMYPTPTLRNFISVMSIHSNGSTDFDSVLQTVKEQYVKYNAKEYFMGIINFNVKSQRNFFIKICPLFIKNIVLKIAFEKYGAKARTTTLSNLGFVNPPQEFLDKVLRYEFILGPQKREMVSFSCCTYNGKTVISCSRTIKENNVVRLFFNKLAADGLDVCLDTNCDAV